MVYFMENPIKMDDLRIVPLFLGVFHPYVKHFPVQMLKFGSHQMADHDILRLAPLHEFTGHSSGRAISLRIRLYVLRKGFHLHSYSKHGIGTLNPIRSGGVWILRVWSHSTIPSYDGVFFIVEKWTFFVSLGNIFSILTHTTNIAG